ncbi:osmotically-inducible protein OsmY [Hydrogenophaga palleronii]|uniref:Osmotically-inducible protein OsmY n=1 Tax=Hydrogenophaga palleronii TaxID=65655 RepID=A0ABU1WTP8_9BURK|nr:BON domain-containing protein [Hydrogenophaga palleronii]MDR7152267.1 osmotically-inducible protein OsmY [Hydrogenophaga palleronii]
MKYAKRYTALIAAAAATALMAACGQKDDTVGQVDQAPMTSAPAPATTAESTLNQPVAPAQEGMNNQDNRGAGEAIAEGANDMAITAKVQAALAADGALSVMDIDVDTEAGRVELTGAAPDENARERATSLVTAVDGVVAVDNRLVVKKDS